MTSEELCFTPAVELARMIREREVSPVEVTRTVLERAEALEPSLNAFVILMAEQAMADARAAESAVQSGAALGPLHGVPVTIKDFNDIKGLPTCYGSNVMKNNIARDDSIVVKRLREAGAIVIGKTTGPDFGWKALGDSPLTGVTRNPWNTDHTPGGSSSGAAATIAAGVAPLALGSDGAGSIRVPAAFCGIVGLKPTLGRVPFPNQAPGYIAHNGPMTRTVADAALMLGVMAGPHGSDPLSCEGPAEDYLGKLQQGVQGLRVAWSPDLGFAKRVHPEVARIAEDAARAFGKLGCTLEDATPPWPSPKPIIDDIWSAGMAGRHGRYLAQFEQQMDPGLVACIRHGQAQPPDTLAQAQIRRTEWSQQTYPFFEQYDLLLTPSVAVPALKVNTLLPEDWEPHAWDWIEWAPFSFPFNLNGYPAITVPAGFTSDGLPVGLQIVSRRFNDLGVLQAAAAFEAACPWAQHRPAL